MYGDRVGLYICTNVTPIIKKCNRFSCSLEFAPFAHYSLLPTVEFPNPVLNKGDRVGSTGFKGGGNPDEQQSQRDA